MLWLSRCNDSCHFHINKSKILQKIIPGNAREQSVQCIQRWCPFEGTVNRQYHFNAPQITGYLLADRGHFTPDISAVEPVALLTAREQLHNMSSWPLLLMKRCEHWSLWLSLNSVNCYQSLSTIQRILYSYARTLHYSQVI